MKLVLSRKGFDSTAGGMPSPVLPDGTLLPLPIPSPRDPHVLADARLPCDDLGALLSDLRPRGSAVSPDLGVHLDPDLVRRPDASEGWRPALGQTGAAAAHLARQGVGPGDLFLFFGWFRGVARRDGRWTWDGPDVHVIFGWLEVGEVLAVATERDRALDRHPWLAAHPHVASPDRYTDPRNAVYVAREESRLVPGLSGGGRLDRLHPACQLTAPGARLRSEWRLPRWFLPDLDDRSRPPLTYHRRASRWTDGGDHAALQAVARGQEFVLDGAAYPEAEAWAADLLRTAASRSSRTM